MMKIPFNRPWAAPRERDYVEAVLKGPIRSGGGPFTKKCQDLITGALGCHAALLTTSGTDALEMAALLIDLQPGDEVILPSFTFVSTANAVVLRGARPVFADVRPDTLNLDERQLPSLITARTRAIIPVHYAGVACAMDEIMAIAKTKNLAVIEDNAHGLFASYRGRQLGSIGGLAALSFHETKNFSCGEGGALLVNDPAFAARAAVLRDKGTNRERFLLGQVDRYSWVDVGSSFLPSEILAAILLSQLDEREAVRQLRARVWFGYQSRLGSWARHHGVGLPVVPADCVSSHHLFHLVMPDLGSRQALIKHLGNLGILAVFHYQPLNASEMGLTLGGRIGQCPVSEDIATRLVRLPLFNSMTLAEQDEVCAGVEGFSP